MKKDEHKLDADAAAAFALLEKAKEQYRVYRELNNVANIGKKPPFPPPKPPSPEFPLTTNIPLAGK